jgi:hypothetical protein
MDLDEDLRRRDQTQSYIQLNDEDSIEGIGEYLEKQLNNVCNRAISLGFADNTINSNINISETPLVSCLDNLPYNKTIEDIDRLYDKSVELNKSINGDINNEILDYGFNED